MVRHQIDEKAFERCQHLGQSDHPRLSDTRWGRLPLHGVQLLGKLDHPRLSDPHWETLPFRVAALW